MSSFLSLRACAQTVARIGMTHGSGVQFVEVVRPHDHHLASLLDELGAVVCSAEPWLRMRKLTLDDVGYYAELFREDRSRARSEPVCGVSVLVEAEPA